MNIRYMSDTHLKTTNQNAEISLSRNINKNARKLTEKLQKSMKDKMKDINQREKTDRNMKDPKDHKAKHHKNSIKRINSTKTINDSINNIAGMGIRTNKLEQIISYLEENHFDILLAQEAKVNFKHKITRTYIERILKKKYHITVSETPFCAITTTKPGGTFVITGTPIMPRIINKISDEAVGWAGNVITV
jgi:TPP-dependent indolepyruvate ferredoxin oxidoreductase alpha subunit